jgi:formamidopyrimidine-DNA glycosylase
MCLRAVEAYGKNLFYFFNSDSDEVGRERKDDVVVHVHFGMSGAFKLFELGAPSSPPATSTTRLRLEEIAKATASPSAPTPLLGGHLSAMLVEYGARDL